MPETIDDIGTCFARLSKAAGRKRVYAQKAAQQGRTAAARLLRAMAVSEAMQARRLFNSYRGHIDTSDQYLASVFETEIEAVIETYTQALQGKDAAEQKATSLLLKQLRAAERRTQSFYSKTKGDLAGPDHDEYHICSFCGHISPETAPDACPVCGAKKEKFTAVR